MVDLNPSLESDSYSNRQVNLDGLEFESPVIRFRDPNCLSLPDSKKVI